MSEEKCAKTSTFQTRIIFLVLFICFLSLGLGTLLGVLSFQKIYLKTLTSEYVILGKDLRRKIEQSLKFGKPLQSFVGMERLIEPLRKQAPELGEVYVTLKDGIVIYPAEKAGEKYNTVLTSQIDWKSKEASVLTDSRMYHVLMTVSSPLSGPVGVLDLVFGKSVIESKIKELLTEMVWALLAALALAGVLIWFLIKYLLVAPMRKQIEEEGFTFLKDPNAFMASSIPDELTGVQTCGAAFVAKTKVFIYKLEYFLEKSAEDEELSEESRGEFLELIRLLRNWSDEEA